jgi:hypothetical protein
MRIKTRAVVVAMMLAPTGSIVGQARNQTLPCGVGTAGTSWRLVEQDVQTSRRDGADGETQRWLEQLTVSGTRTQWQLRLIRTPLSPSGRRDSLVVSSATRGQAPEARSELPPCARLSVGTSVRTRLAGSRDSITWRITRIVDTLGTRAVELLADRVVDDTVSAEAMQVSADTTGITRTNTLRALGRLSGRETRRRLVQRSDGALLLDEVERRTTGTLAGATYVAGAATRVVRTEIRPLTATAVALITSPMFPDDSMIIVTASTNTGRGGWRQVGDTIELRSRTADGWPSAERVVYTAAGTVAWVDDIVPLMTPAVVRWTVRDGSLVPDFDAGLAFPLPVGRSWGVASDGTLETLGPVFAQQPADSAWHNFTLLVPSRRGVQRSDAEVRIRRIADHFVVHLRSPERCPIVATLLFNAGWVPLLANVGSAFGETRVPAPGSVRGRLLEAATRVVRQEDLYPRISMAKAARGGC